MRGERVPTWPELRARLNAPTFRTATGTMRWHNRTDEVDGPAEGTCRFVYAREDRLRVEDDLGPLHVQDEHAAYVRDERGRMVRYPAGSGHWIPRRDGHPWTLLGRPGEHGDLYDEANDFGWAAGPVERVEAAGRAAWQVVLPPPARKPYALILVLDGETGAPLRMAGSEGGDAFVVEMTEFAPDVPVEDAAFRWTGPYVDVAVIEAERAEEWRRRERPRDGKSLAPARERLRILRILAAAIERRREVADAVADAPDLAEARRALGALLGVDPEDTTYVLDLQFRRLSPPEAARLRQEIAELEEHLRGYPGS